MEKLEKCINIAIIAHVDHGKTTLIDSILTQTGQYRDNETIQNRAMDSNDLEKERGITIFAKCTAIFWKGYKINIIDTPGHADFGGEVERILGMVDSVIMLVDAAEGPLPQTKFVLIKALNLGLKPIVVINKVDRADARISEVLNEILELFIAVNASEEQIDFTTFYASGRNGWASLQKDVQTKNLHPLLDTIIQQVPVAKKNDEAPFKMLCVILEVDPHLGPLFTGKIESGVAKVNMQVKALNLDGSLVETGRISRIFTFNGLKRVSVTEGYSGDICVISGLKKATVTNTICDMNVEEPIKASEIDPPTLSINFLVNDSPFVGKEGTKSTLRMIGERLFQEAEKNIAISVIVSENNDAYCVSGRGELQLGILIETMRREGFEFSISRPKVIMKKDESNQLVEPIEEALIDVDDEYTGVVVEKLSIRKGVVQDIFSIGGAKTRLVFNIPTRGLIGYHSEFLTDTRGTGIMNRCFKDYEPYRGAIAKRLNGVLVSMENGSATAYSIFALEDRGSMFVSPGDKVYEGMIVGLHSKSNDLEINVVKGKQLTNMRASGKDDAIKCTKAIKLQLEEAMSFIEDDELIEVTPESIRLRKLHLTSSDRKRSFKSPIDFK